MNIIELIPNEIIFHIGMFLDFSDLSQLGKASRGLLQVANQIIENRFPQLKWRLDLFFPPNELPEGLLILNYRSEKRRYLRDHPYRKYRRLSMISKGFPKHLVKAYPTIKLQLPLWMIGDRTRRNFVSDRRSDNNGSCNLRFLSDEKASSDKEEILATIDMI